MWTRGGFEVIGYNPSVSPVVRHGYFFFYLLYEALPTHDNLLSKCIIYSYARALPDPVIIAHYSIWSSIIFLHSACNAMKKLSYSDPDFIKKVTSDARADGGITTSSEVRTHHSLTRFFSPTS